MYSSRNKFDTFAVPSAPVTNLPTVLPVTLRMTSNSALAKAFPSSPFLSMTISNVYPSAEPLAV